MKIGVVGVGGGGTALADALVAADADSSAPFLVDAVAVDTDAAALEALDGIADDDRHLLGAVHTDGNGTAGDAGEAARIAREERPELQAAVDSLPVGSIDATVVCAALGGGTGAGVAPAVVDVLGQVTGTPVYVAGALPGVAEVGGDGAAADATSDGPKRADEEADTDGPDRPLASNAADAVGTLTASADDLVLVDPDVWRASGASYEATWPRQDAALAERLGALFAAGEATEPTPERVLDASELTNTFGADGVSVVGAASTAVENGRRDGVVGGLLDKLGGGAEPDVDEGEAVSVAVNTARKAVTHRLSLPCDLTSASRAAIAFHAPPGWLSRRGLERARSLVAEETGVPEIRWGDHPDPHAESFRVTVLLSGVDDSDRLTALEQTVGANRLV
ncbi:hypothetical protein [Halobaculum marinum]|uniref:Tubulin-like protein CetZ n=1 Tax=Halobaculum marinum TaxID=3031996 RepID=A0ABD5WS34_9EURY|nr:hypothetical protein [Halobaculum sp. DT55]